MEKKGGLLTDIRNNRNAVTDRVTDKNELNI